MLSAVRSCSGRFRASCLVKITIVRLDLRARSTWSRGQPGPSAASTERRAAEVADLERYLDVTRAEALFARYYSRTLS